MRTIGRFLAVSAGLWFPGCHDRDLERIGPNPELLGALGGPKQEVSVILDNVSNFPFIDAAVLKGVVGTTNWAKRIVKETKIDLPVKKVDLQTFIAIRSKKMFDKSIFAKKKALRFGSECEPSVIDFVSTEIFKTFSTPEYRIVNIRGCLSVEPKAYALFELNMIVGEEKLVTPYMNEKLEKSPMKRLVDGNSWQPLGSRVEKSMNQYIDPKTSGTFLDKLTNIVKHFFVKDEGYLSKYKISAILFRMTRFNTDKKGAVIVVPKQSVKPVIVYVSTNRA